MSDTCFYATSGTFSMKKAPHEAEKVPTVCNGSSGMPLRIRYMKQVFLLTVLLHMSYVLVSCFSFHDLP